MSTGSLILWVCHVHISSLPTSQAQYVYTCTLTCGIFLPCMQRSKWLFLFTNQKQLHGLPVHVHPSTTLHSTMLPGQPYTNSHCNSSMSLTSSTAAGADSKTGLLRVVFAPSTVTSGATLLLSACPCPPCAPMTAFEPGRVLCQQAYVLYFIASDNLQLQP